MISDELSKWLEGRPEEIRIAVEKKPPDRMYRLKSSGHIVSICSYQEANAGAGAERCGFCQHSLLVEHSHLTFDETTVTVLVLAAHNPRIAFERKVFGIKLDDLEEVPDGD